MHVEIQVALNFLISFLYNKLPRRRVNQFGEELDHALKIKFEGHWYPEKPFKGSAYRCVRCAPPLDPTVFETAARASGMDLADIQENLPQELSIWIDPGEVSYRMSEKGPVKILFSEHGENSQKRENNMDREVIRTFNPEAQCFKPIESISTQFNRMNLANATTPPSNAFNGDVSPPHNFKNTQQQQQQQQPTNGHVNGFKGNPFNFTAASFAQTKFGSTKLKSNTKRSHRMSPTEFSNYIKQKAIQQQQSGSGQGGLPQQMANNVLFSPSSSATNSRSLSPNLGQVDLSISPNNYLLMPSLTNSHSSITPNINTSSNNSMSPFGNPTSQNGSNLFPQSASANSLQNIFSSGGSFENAFLSDMVGSLGSLGSGERDISKSIPIPNNQQKQQQNMNAINNRFSSFLDKASPFVSTPGNSLMNGMMKTAINGEQHLVSNANNANSTFNVNNLPSSSSDANNSSGSSSGSDSASSSFDNINYNLNGVNTYPNQFQHLLVAN